MSSVNFLDKLLDGAGVVIATDGAAGPVGLEVGPFGRLVPVRAADGQGHAQADEFASQFPNGYGTLIGERGVGLSGGQKQRIAIARALLLDPHILILDDSTSSVNMATEAQIQRALDRLMKGRTSFVIAQRISTVMKADQILDGLGGYHTYGQAERSDITARERLLPMGLAMGCRLIRDVPKDQVLSYDDVELPDGRLVDQLRREQAEYFRT